MHSHITCVIRFLGWLLLQAVQQYHAMSVVKGISTDNAAKPVVSMHIISAHE